MSDEKTNVLAKQEEIQERVAAAAVQQAEAEAAARDEVTAAIEREIEAQNRKYEQSKTQAEAERDRALEALQEHERVLQRVEEADQQHRQVIAQNMEATTSNVIGSLTDVLSQLQQGSATADEAAQMMLASFLQMLSRMAAVQALAEVARAISSYPDVAGIAAHIAGALAWGAVAVATGVGGAAVSAGVSRAQSARAAAEQPASPRSAGVTEGKGGGTTVINFLGPVMTAQGEATFGRMINHASDSARARFAST